MQAQGPGRRSPRWCAWISSKGVGIYFISQNPLDIPDDAWASSATASSTPCAPSRQRTRRQVRAAADLGPGPGSTPPRRSPNLVSARRCASCLDAKGSPQPVARVLIRPAMTRLSPLNADERKQVIAASLIGNRYDAA
ncbi:MAG: helicase HerA-like domain-containing protein [Alphaproteobacteria bacterium]